MLPLLADVNVEGQVARLVSLMQSEYWCELWDHLEIQSRRFRDLGLDSDVTDALLWRFCQQHQLADE